MSGLGEHLEDYLRLRRGLGFQMDQQASYLSRFVAFLDARGAATVTSDLALEWARSAATVKTITVGYRLSAVRGFARYLHALDPVHEIPASGLVAADRRRPVPHIYTADQIAALLYMAGRVRPPLRGLTLRALLGFVASTGMRLGETMALSRGDVDLVAGVVTVRHAKFDRLRLVPLHASVTDELGNYADERDRLCSTPSCERFFVSATGRALQRRDVDVVFAEITTTIGLRTDTVRPRVHDLRHTFAVRTLIDAHQRGADINAVLPVLSTYLGHVEPANTYWYLEAVPELMQLAAARLEAHQAGQP